MSTPALVQCVSIGAKRHYPIESPPEWVEDRGVYLARHTVRRKRVLYAVDSTGDVVKWVRLGRNQSEDEVTAYLWDVLNVVDPQPTLALIRAS